MSAPFLFPIHAEPYDFQRLTESKIRCVRESTGFSNCKLLPVEGIGAVIHDLLYLSFGKIQKRHLKSISLLGLLFINPLFTLVDRMLKSPANIITTGHFVTSTK